MKKLIGLFAVIFCLCFAVTFTACTDDAGETGGSSGHVHSYTQLVIEPTCSATGFTLYECSCGHTYKGDETPIDPNGHNYNESGRCKLCNYAINFSNDIVYDTSVDGTYAEVVKYTGNEPGVNIASTYNNLPVKSICKEAFKDSKILSRIVIPDSVTTIGESAFSGCERLSSVTLGNNVTSIGNYAFYDCTGLTNITIPDSVTSIGGGAFNDCESLAKVIIGYGVTSIGKDAFNNCSKFANITIPGSVTSFDGAF